MRSVIEQQYNQHSINFEETVNFLKTIGIIRITKKELRLYDNYYKVDKKIIIGLVDFKSDYEDAILFRWRMECHHSYLLTDQIHKKLGNSPERELSLLGEILNIHPAERVEIYKSF